MRGARRFSGMVFLIATVTISGAALFLATWDMLPSVKNIERIIPDEFFPQ